MEYYKKAKKIMNIDSADFVGGVSESEIEKAMKTLSVTFPESYKAFLTDFGGGDAGGEIIFGITNNEYDDVVITTQTERSQGMPDNLVIIGFRHDKLIGTDTLVCLDTGKMSNGECPVIEVNGDYSEIEVIADTFGKFLFEYYNDDEAYYKF
ncbi:MAG: SMI1/KNR4 family protein [Oscillospiraceae bacterium]|nr:SMI1/KNR4 family protein [Oscillospiraceae bacterium]